MNAYAYIDSEGTVDIDTVSSTERAAKVNAIVTGSYGNMVPLNEHSDADIDRMFLNVSGGVGTIEKVTIKPHH